MQNDELNLEDFFDTPDQIEIAAKIILRKDQVAKLVGKDHKAPLIAYLKTDTNKLYAKLEQTTSKKLYCQFVLLAGDQYSLKDLNPQPKDTRA